ncbi:hypothetical protein Hypma_006610 [Hypsizygus marmoreus]|uniref:SHSP domain-containing protein n=1 Tax=Hypsizygus marmoreus TaxID=39966 RepID=A0A369K0Z1_HYPMA|nr:hypothetical protein Hypma_006610 [Hypsizygus marmoreus]
MPAYTHHHLNRREALTIPADGGSRTFDKANPSPVTPAVTGIVYPSTPLDSITEADSSHYRMPSNRFYTHPNIAASTLDDGAPRPLSEGHSLDQLWGTIRQQKELKMAKERPKVQSLEEMANELSLEPNPVDIPVLESQPSAPRSLKKQKSISSFRESTDGRSIVATFDLPNVEKQDIHVSFQRTRLVVTWATAELSEWEEDGVLMRERFERMYHRTLPLPEGTKFEEVRGVRNGRQLTLRYPNMRCYRVESRSRSGES